MDYTVMALESSLETLKMIQQYEVTTMREEAAFIETCLESGFITVMEAEQKEGIVKRMVNACKEFLNRILTAFKTRSVESCERYLGWITANREVFKKRAAKQSPIKLMPLWKGEWEQDSATVISALQKAYNNYANKKYDDYSWCKTLVNDEELVKNQDSNLPEYLKNKFRYNEIGKLQMEPVRITGGELAELVDEMVDYLIKYKDGPSKHADNIQKTYNRRLDTLKEPTGAVPTTSETSEAPKTTEVTQSNENAFVRLYGKPVCETELVNMINYSVVYEKVDDKNEEKPPAINDKNAKEGEKVEQTHDVVKTGDKETQDESDKEKDAVSGTNNETNKVEKDKSEDAVNYLKDCDHFFKLCITAYITAAEERFKSYVNVMLTIGDETGKPPKVDKDGKYKSQENPTKVSKDDGSDESSKDESVDAKSMSKKQLMVEFLDNMEKDETELSKKELVKSKKYIDDVFKQINNAKTDKEATQIFKKFIINAPDVI